MKIIIDADACPVKIQAVEIAKKNKIEVIYVCDTAHQLSSDYASVITVDKGSDSADYKIIALLDEGDIVITQDFGVAAMALSKNCYGINQNGMVYTADNIDKLLFERFLGAKGRRQGHRSKGPKKRSKDDDIAFIKSFENLVKSAIN